MPRLKGAHTGGPLQNAYEAEREGWKTLMCLVTKQELDGRQRYRVYRTADTAVLRQVLQDTLMALDEEAVSD